MISQLRPLADLRSAAVDCSQFVLAVHAEPAAAAPGAIAANAPPRPEAPERVGVL